MIDGPEINGVPPALAGVRCDGLVCEQYWHEGKLDSPANVTYFRVGRTWHRLYFDSSIVFWRTQSDPPIPFAMPEIDSEAKLDDVGTRLGLVGRVLESYETSTIPGGSQVLFTFEGGRQIAIENINDTTTMAT